jgi:hypothetical protein
MENWNLQQFEGILKGFDSPYHIVVKGEKIEKSIAQWESV